MHEAQNVAERLARLMAGEDGIGDDEGAGIDERIARLALCLLYTSPSPRD